MVETKAALMLLIIGAVMLVGAGITAAIGTGITQTITNTLVSAGGNTSTANFSCGGSTACLASNNATTGIGSLAAQIPNIGTVLGASAILAVIFGILLLVVGGRKGKE